MAQSSGWDDLCHDMLGDGWAEFSLDYVEASDAASQSLNEAPPPSNLPGPLAGNAGPTHIQIVDEHLKSLQTPQVHYQDLLAGPFSKVLAEALLLDDDQLTSLNQEVPKIADFFLAAGSKLHSSK